MVPAMELEDGGGVLLKQGRERTGSLGRRCVRSSLRAPGVASAGLGVWGEEGLSAGTSVLLGKEVASSAAAGAPGGPEVADAEQECGFDGSVVVEVEMPRQLDFEGLGLGFGGASGSFPCWLLCIL